VSNTLQVQLFLIRLKQIWKTPERITIAPREKNLQSMASLNIAMTDVQEMCLMLKPTDRYLGPVAHDRGFSGEVWLFTPVFRGTKMYLKFWLQSHGGEDHIQIISCHAEGMV
jgi:hypothetical protein